MVAFHEALLARGLESPYGEWLANWSTDRPGSRAAGDHPGRSAPTGSPCATRRSRPTPRRSTRPAAGSTSRATCSARSGRPRTTSSSARWSTRRCPEDDLFAGIERVGPGASGELSRCGRRAGLAGERGRWRRCWSISARCRSGSRVALVLAQNPAPPPGQGRRSSARRRRSRWSSSSCCSLATVLLIRSMTKRIRRLPASFDGPPARGDGLRRRPAGAGPRRTPRHARRTTRGRARRG